MSNKPLEPLTGVGVFSLFIGHAPDQEYIHSASFSSVCHLGRCFGSAYLESPRLESN